MFSMAGKTCAITGASGGIGSAIARRFAREGARMVLIGRPVSSDKLATLLHDVDQASPFPSAPSDRRGPQSDMDPPDRAQSPAGHSVVLGNAGQARAWTAADSAMPRHLDVLVNCAGLAQQSLLMRTDPAVIRDLLAANLEAAILGCRHFARTRAAGKRGGCIINVSSLLARKGVAGTSVYAAAKAALLGLTSSLAVEYAPLGIRVNAILPGYIDTGMTKDLKGKQELEARIPLGRLGTPDEVADATAFLAKNPYATNCILNLDGGLSAA